MTLRTLMQAGPTKANELFAKLAETTEGAWKTRERLFAELKAELEAHVSLEEQHLFPVLRRHADTKDLIAVAIKDNKELRAALVELDALPKNEEAFPAKLADLRKTFRQHARDETKELLPAVLRALSEEQVQGITERMESSLAEAEQAKHDAEEERRMTARRDREQAEAKAKQTEAAERGRRQQAEAQAHTRNALNQVRQGAARRTHEAALSTTEAASRMAMAATEAATQAVRNASPRAVPTPLTTGIMFWDMWMGMAGLQPSRPAPARAADRSPASAPGQAAYGHEQVIPLAEEVLTVGTRTVSAGTTRVRRYVVETPVEKQVTLVRERVVVERRRPLTDEVNGQVLTEVTVELIETDEVPVVGKVLRLKDEVIVRTERAERVETVRDTVRHDEIEIDHAEVPSARLRSPARSSSRG